MATIRRIIRTITMVPLSIFVPSIIPTTTTTTTAVWIRRSPHWTGNDDMSTSTPRSTILLRLQYPTNSLMHRLQLAQIGCTNLDGVACHGQYDNILPWMELVLVFDHLRSLPIVLYACTLQAELLHLHRDGTTGLGFDDGDIVLGLLGTCACIITKNASKLE